MGNSNTKKSEKSPKWRRTRIDFKPFLKLRHIVLLSAKYGKYGDSGDLKIFEKF